MLNNRKLAFFSGLSHKWGIPLSLLYTTVSLYALDCPQYSNSKDDDQATVKAEKLGGINLSKEASHDFNRVVDKCLLTTRIN